MKICGIICEFNPFHNGHKYILEKVRSLSGCDAVVCIMSGSFTQRGDICILDKFLRAKHAVCGGADCVIELPVAFAVSPAEIFAAGAVKILSSIPDLDTIAFGTEYGCEQDFLNAAELLLNENEEFKNTLQTNLSTGLSYIKSYSAAFKAVGGNDKLLSNPNSILGVEYAKAVLKSGKNIKLLPVKRIGAEYSDGRLKNDLSSASAIRQNLSSPLVKNNVPDFVFGDLKDFSAETDKYNSFLKLILSRTPAKDLMRIYGCNDGLENVLKNLQSLPLNEIIDRATSKRFTSSRIKRIICSNFLELYSADCEKFLNAKLYLYPLAVKKKSADFIFSALSNSPYPVLTSGSDEQKLNKTAAICKEKDDFSYSQWLQITERQPINKFISI